MLAIFRWNYVASDEAENPTLETTWFYEATFRLKEQKRSNWWRFVPVAKQVHLSINRKIQYELILRHDINDKPSLVELRSNRVWHIEKMHNCDDARANTYTPYQLAIVLDDETGCLIELHVQIKFAVATAIADEPRHS